MNFTDDKIAIDNAPWWLNHSHVLIKEDMLAEDQEWIANRTNHIVQQGTPQAHIETRIGSAGILTIKRMVIEGTVAVNRANGRVKTVRLPQEAEKLLAMDVEYIVAQIAKYNTPMTEAEQNDFLPGVNGHIEENLQRAK